MKLQLLVLVSDLFFAFLDLLFLVSELLVTVVEL